MATIYDQLNRFCDELRRRAENRNHIGEPGRCARCGEHCGTWTKCKPCRMKQYEDDARGGPPLGEHWPTPPAKPLPDLIDETPINNSEVPWE